MTTCCETLQQQNGASELFSRQAGRYARRFRRRGLERVQRHLLDGVRLEPVEGKTILDIACGIGALHLSLLQEGAVQATGIDISGGMIDKARELANEFGVSTRASYTVGDFVDRAGEVQEADVTLLDKFVCCYEEIDTLVRVSTGKTKRIYAVSHPRENFMTRSIFKSQIALAKLFGWKFHPFWHDWERLRLDIQRHGFELIHSGVTPMWQVLVFRRTKT